MRSYTLHVVQALRADDRATHVKFSDGTFLPRLILLMKQHLISAAKVNHRNFRIWGLEYPQEVLEYHRDSPKVNMSCAVP